MEAARQMMNGNDEQEDESGLRAHIQRLEKELMVRIRIEDALWERHAVSEKIIRDALPGGILHLSREERILSANGDAIELLDLPRNPRGLAFDEIAGRFITAPLNAESVPGPEGVAIPMDSGPATLGYRKKNGEVRWLHARALPFENPATGEVAGSLISFIDITARKNAEAAHRRLSDLLAHQASHDGLTRLANRYNFESAVNQALRAPERNHILCSIDVDGFRLVNDIAGHTAGDEFLRRVAFLLRNQLPEGALLARVGADEFGVLLEKTSPGGARLFTERLLQTFGTFRFHREGRMFETGLSIGMVDLSQRGGDYSSLLRDAEAARFIAHDEGGNVAVFFDAKDERHIRERNETVWNSRILKALEHNRFELYCQPIRPLRADAGSSERVALEILIRMLDEDNTAIAPGWFIPAAERFRLMTRLDMWVVLNTLYSLRANAALLDQIEFISVNLSGLSLTNKRFHAQVEHWLAETGVPGDKLCFEVTETAAIDNLDEAARFMRRLRALGCRFALDDFGSGVSSFGYLRDLPVDLVKIDGMFVKEILNNPVDAVMVKSIHDMNRAMGKFTIAEYVENEEILSKVRDLGINYAQGHAVGAALPLSEFWKQSGARRTGGPAVPE